MSGKVLGSGHHAELVRAFDVRDRHLANLRRVFAERACVDDRIVGIRVHVHVRKPIPLHPDGAGLHGGDATGLAGEVGITRGAKRHGVRKYCDFIETHAEAALEVGGEEQRKFGVLLKLVGDQCSFERLVFVEESVFVIDGEAEPAEVVLAQSSHAMPRTRDRGC